MNGKFFTDRCRVSLSKKFSMNNVPFVIKKQLIPLILCKSLLQLARRPRKIQWEFIFLNADMMDMFREQAHAPDDEQCVQDVQRIIANEIKNWNPSWSAKKFVFLRSKVGGARQAPHRDYYNSDIESLPVMALPGGCIIALEGETRVGHYGANRFRAVKDEEKIISLAPGDVLLFRADLIHCGMEYERTNIRMHCYLDNKHREEIDNVTQHVAFEEFFCPKCQGSYLSKKALIEHKSTCVEFNCSVCPRIYSENQEEAFRKHKKRKHGH